MSDAVIIAVIAALPGVLGILIDIYLSVRNGQRTERIHGIVNGQRDAMVNRIAEQDRIIRALQQREEKRIGGQKP